MRLKVKIKNSPLLYSAHRIAKSIQRIGTTPGAMITGACDFGLAEIGDGELIGITWGRNLTLDQADALGRTCVWVGIVNDVGGTSRDNYEVML